MLYNILALGDVTSEDAVRHVQKHLRRVQKEKNIAFVVMKPLAGGAIEDAKKEKEKAEAEEGAEKPSKSITECWKPTGRSSFRTPHPA